MGNASEGESMHEGLYEIRFKTAQGEGRGLVTLKSGEILGGDAIILYAGTYNTGNGQVTAHVKTRRYASVPGMISVFGRDDVQIEFIGTVNGDSIVGNGSSPNAPGISLNVSMRRLAP